MLIYNITRVDYKHSFIGKSDGMEKMFVYTDNCNET